jgi:hypothetical protein
MLYHVSAIVLSQYVLYAEHHVAFVPPPPHKKHLQAFIGVGSINLYSLHPQIFVVFDFYTNFDYSSY